MDQWKTKFELHQRHQDHQYQYIPNEQREMIEVEVKDTNDARKVQKADREKLRRDRLNEQFIELGNVLDPDRPKHDKASIINDTIQVLKDLTTEVNRLKAECASLSEESCELTQEKNELREEKSSLKSDTENLNAQYQQRTGVMFPWGAINPSSVVMPSPYSYPVALPVPAGPVPVPMHPFSFMSYPNPVNTHINQTIPVYPSTSYNSSNVEKVDNSSDVVTELELKTPGSRRSGWESLAGDKKGKEKSSSSRYTCSSQGFQDSSSNSVVDNNDGV